MNEMTVGLIALAVILLVVITFMVWLLWNAFRSWDWHWLWRTISGIVGFVLLMFLAAFGLMIAHGFEDARAMRSFGCRMSLLELGKAMAMYAGENDERAPLANWVDGLSSYVGRQTHLCPMSDSSYPYTMNKAFVGALYSDPTLANTAVLFDGPGGKNSVGDLLDAQYRHDGDRALFLFDDGLVDSLTTGEPRRRQR
jgi:hypothetical protein